MADSSICPSGRPFLRGLVVLLVGFVPVVRKLFVLALLISGSVRFARFWKHSPCMIWRDELSRRRIFLPVEIGSCVAD